MVTRESTSGKKIWGGGEGSVSYTIKAGDVYRRGEYGLYAGDGDSGTGDSSTEDASSILSGKQHASGTEGQGSAALAFIQLHLKGWKGMKTKEAVMFLT